MSSVDHPTRPPALTRPARMQLLAVLAVAACCCLALGGAALSRPLTKTVKAKTAYTQSGRLTYSAPVSPGSVYGAASLHTGEPVILGPAKQLTLDFTYHLSSKAAVTAGGTSQMVAVLDNGQGLTRSIVVQPPKPFHGTTARAAGTLDLGRLQALIATFASHVGISGGSYDVHLVPRFSVRGSVAGHQLVTTFAPAVPFTVSTSPSRHDVMTLAAPPATGSLVGTTPKPADSLTPSSPGAVSYRTVAPTTIDLAVAHPTVHQAEVAALVGLLACLALGLLVGLPLLGKAAGGEVDRIQARYGSRVVPVDSVAMPGGPVVDVADMASLVELGRRYDLAVLHTSAGDGDGDDYLVLDGGVAYRYRVPAPAGAGASEPVAAPDERAAAPAPASPPAGALAGLGSWNLTAVNGSDG
ncbi:MAG: hypothetical protein ACRD0J_18745 [Acidimicrobiales bacterium]